MTDNKRGVMEEIYHSALTFLVPLNSHDTFPLLVSEAMKLMHAKSGSIFLPNGENFQRSYASSPELYNVQPSLLGKTKKAFVEKKIFVEDYHDLIKTHPHFKENEVGSDLCAPLTYNNNAIGVLSLQSYPGKSFSKEDLEKLELFLPMATLAFRKSQLHDDVQNALQFRDMFISMASHELKTPLTAIYSYAQLIDRQVSKDQSPMHKYSVHLMNAVLRMKRLVEELLTVDNINNNELKYRMQPCTLLHIVTRTISEFLISHPDAQIKFENQMQNKETRIMADFDKLMQVLNNVLINACKYSAKSSTIKIQLFTREKYVIISIKDEGKGISSSDLPNVFNPFYRGEGSGSGGKGLGLYIVKKIVESHQGSVTISSKLEKGTEVQIKLPIIYESGTTTTAG